MNYLNQENYSKGFLVDEDLMGGVTQDPVNSEIFVAFVLQHTTGEYLGYQPFPALEAALKTINQIPRSWTYERFGGCGGCGEGGQCAIGSNGKCGQGKCCPTPST